MFVTLPNSGSGRSFARTPRRSYATSFASTSSRIVATIHVLVTVTASSTFACSATSVVQSPNDGLSYVAAISFHFGA
jgi:hypothetical protein